MDEKVKTTPEADVAVETKDATANAAKKAKKIGLIIGISVAAVILLIIFILVVSLIIVFIKDATTFEKTYALDEWESILTTDGFDHLFK